MHSATGGGSFYGVACPCPQRARPARGERCRRLDPVRPQPRWAMAISIHPSLLVALRLPGACGRSLHPGRASAVHQPRTRVVLPADPVELPTGDCAHRMGGSEALSLQAKGKSGFITGVAWLIPYCARHHPLQSETQRVPGTLSASFTQGGGRLGWPSLRASTEHSIRLCPERINPECAVREHNGQPCRPAPLSCVRDARARESAWPPHARSCIRGARTSGASQPPRSPFSASCLRVEFVQHTWERNGLPDVVQTTDPGYNPFDSHPEAGVGDGSVPPEIHIPPERRFGKFMFLNASQ